MLANRLNSFLKTRNIHYGWIMSFLVFFMTIFSAAVGSSPQILILPLNEEFNWSISDISIAIALMYLILASISPFSGALILKFGITRIILVTIILDLLSLLLTVLAFEKWHLLVSIGMCLGVASGIIGLGLAATVATRWFNKKRGLVVGVLTAAYAAGTLLFVPLMAWITTQVDWRYALLPPMLGISFSGILFLLFSEDWPSELNLPPLGSDKIFIPPSENKNNFVSLSFKILFDAIYHPAFWILALTFLICGLTSTGIVGQHFIPFCADNNIGIVVASSYLAIMGIFNFIGTTFSGWLSDRFDNYKLLMIYYSLRGVSLIYLPYSDFSVYALTLWAIFFGLDFVATVPPTVRLTSKYFGTVNGPVLFGWIFASHQFGSAIAAYGAGFTRDSLLSYVPAFLFAGLLCFVASLMIITFKLSSLKRV